MSDLWTSRTKLCAFPTGPFNILIVRCPRQNLFIEEELLKYIDTFSKEEGLESEVKDMANMPNSPLNRVGLELVCTLCHAGNTISYIILGKITALPFDAT